MDSDETAAAARSLAPLDGPVSVLGRFANASNAALLVMLDTGGAAAHTPVVDISAVPYGQLAVYKPQRGEAPLWDFAAGTLHCREVAAYRLSEALGWGLVPETVLRDDLPYGPGSVQRFVPHDPWWQYFTVMSHDAERFSVALMKTALFDLLCNNADRKAGHVLMRDVRVPPGGALDTPDLPAAATVQLVDHGVTFHHEPKLRTVIWDFAGAHLPDGLRRDITSVQQRFDDTLAGALRDLLDDAEIAACRERFADVVALECFPHPAHERAFPWPLV